jgi:nitrate/nitrite transporter NarK
MGGNAVYFAVNVDVAPQRAASAFGIMNLAFAVSGFLAPVVTGSVLKLQGSFAGAFWLMAVLGFASVVVVLCLHDPDRDRLTPA